MNKVREYRRQRALGNPASMAWWHAKTNAAFYAAESSCDHDRRERCSCDVDVGEVGLHVVPDECADLSFLDQACFADVRERELERADRDGVWGVVSQAWDGEAWEDVDSCFGFIGEDWQDSGYDVDIKASALERAEDLLERDRRLRVL